MYSTEHLKIVKMSQALVAHFYNPSYLGEVKIRRIMA
jgi:hypothetical protein